MKNQIFLLFIAFYHCVQLFAIELLELFAWNGWTRGSECFLMTTESLAVGLFRDRIVCLLCPQNETCFLVTWKHRFNKDR